MANIRRAPTQWCLNKHETINTFENWKQNLIYTLSLDVNFAEFIATDAQWQKKTAARPDRGLAGNNDATTQQRVYSLELMLGQIANYCPVISRNTIVKNSTSLSTIWQTIRLHYGFQSTGSHFIDFVDIHLQPDERPEDLYQRLVAFVEDNLLQRDSQILHHGDVTTVDEELSPSLENMIVLTWLRLINTALPKLVKQRYGTELRTRTLSSIKPEISQALDSLLDEITSAEDAKVMRAAAGARSQNRFWPQKQQRRPSNRNCPLCKQAGRKDIHHFLSECTHLPESDRRFMQPKVRGTDVCDFDDEYPDQQPAPDEGEPLEQPQIQRIDVRQSPYLDAFCGHHMVRLTIDSGATGNMIRQSTAIRLGCDIKKSSQSAHQADGSSPLTIIGETSICLTRKNNKFAFTGLVVQNLDVELLAGTPFMEINDVAIRPAKRIISLADGTTCTYGTTDTALNRHAIRRAHVLRAPSTNTTVWPGEFVEVNLPADLFIEDSTFALEPRLDSNGNKSVRDDDAWPQPSLITSIDGLLRIPNLTNTTRVLKKNEHFCQIREVFVPDIAANNLNTHVISQAVHTQSSEGHSASVQIDPESKLSPDERASFRSILDEYDEVFDPNYAGYNGHVGPFEAVVNMGPVQPPQRKGHLPQYARNQLVELQAKFDELETMGVFVRPEDVPVNVEYLNPSFLIKKRSRGHRLVTAFSDVGRYSKPQPSLMPDVDGTLRKIAQWQYIATTDLSNAFYQIPLSRDSMKYCGVVTPFRGVRVYARSAMGMPGSETALEELLCRVLGDLLEEGVVAKLADDIYCGGNTIAELQRNVRRLLQCFADSGLRLSATKTTICPTKTMILGWVWNLGTIQASSHRIATLASCDTPVTVKAMRSFVGAYKMLARVVPGCSALLAPFDSVTGGRQSSEHIEWNDSLQEAFKRAKDKLQTRKTITLPRSTDELWLVTDGSVKQCGLGATLYVMRNDTLKLAGFFSAKLRGRQIDWLPCEIEALSIAAAVKHFSAYIVQSNHTTSILTDSKPCVQAHEKLCRGEFSVSPRVSTFLSAVSRYQATVRHLAGSANVPSDFASRNAAVCVEQQCQVCTFIREMEESVVMQRVTTNDITSGRAKLPFTSRSAWLTIQAECQDLRRTHAHLKQGTRPSKKITNAKDVKRYLNVASIARDGMLVVRRNDPLSPSRECIIVPRMVLNGLVTALHIQLDHPSAHQLKQVMRRYLFALDLDRAIETTSHSCHHCASLINTPTMTVPQSTSDPPEVVGISYAADIIKRERQLILVLSECVTSYTACCFVTDERRDTIRDSLINLCIGLRPLDGPPAVIRTDPAPGFAALANDAVLAKYRLTIELGRVKNVNKNPVAEKAVRELECELLHQQPTGGTVTQLVLSVATANLNTRIRNKGFSARELWTQRDQFTNEQLPLTDYNLIRQQHALRNANHAHSQLSKSHDGALPKSQHIDVGDIVYLYADRNKTRSRCRYIVVSTDGSWLNINKFIGTQLRATSYRVKRSECYKVVANTPDSTVTYEYEDEIDAPIPDATPEPLPSIPAQLSYPALPDEAQPVQPAPQHQPLIASDEKTQDSADEQDFPTEQLPRRSTRVRKPPDYLRF